MDYFDGIHFLHHAEVRRYRHVVDGHQAYWGIQYNHAGPVDLQIDDGPNHRSDGPQVFLTFPGPRFRYGSPAGAWRHHLYIAFAGPRTQAMEAGELLVRDAQPRAIARPAAFIQELRTTQQAIMRRDWAEAVHRLEGILLTLRCCDRPSAGQPAGVAELAERIRREPQREWDLDHEAGLLGVSADHLRRLFRHTCNESFRQFILGSRVERAAEALCSTGATVDTIARDWGFHDAQHLSRFFRRRYGMPPGAYRRVFGRTNPDLAVHSPRR